MAGEYTPVPFSSINSSELHHLHGWGWGGSGPSDPLASYAAATETVDKTPLELILLWTTYVQHVKAYAVDAIFFWWNYWKFGFHNLHRISDRNEKQTKITYQKNTSHVSLHKGRSHGAEKNHFNLTVTLQIGPFTKTNTIYRQCRHEMLCLLSLCSKRTKIYTLLKIPPQISIHTVGATSSMGK